MSDAEVEQVLDKSMILFRFLQVIFTLVHAAAAAAVVIVFVANSVNRVMWVIPSPEPIKVTAAEDICLHKPQDGLTTIVLCHLSLASKRRPIGQRTGVRSYLNSFSHQQEYLRFTFING